MCMSENLIKELGLHFIEKKFLHHVPNTPKLEFPQGQYQFAELNTAEQYHFNPDDPAPPRTLLARILASRSSIRADVCHVFLELRSHIIFFV
jgi:hypothetical protein